MTNLSVQLNMDTTEKRDNDLNLSTKESETLEVQQNQQQSRKQGVRSTG